MGPDPGKVLSLEPSIETINSIERRFGCMRREWINSKSLGRLASLLLSLIIGIVVSVGVLAPLWPPAAFAQEDTAVAAETAPEPQRLLEAKIDVNNTILRNYRQLPGFYPTLARILVLNAPYESLEQMLEIPELTDRQKDLIRTNFPNFEIRPYQPGSYQLEDRINQGYYG